MRNRLLTIGTVVTMALYRGAQCADCTGSETIVDVGMRNNIKKEADIGIALAVDGISLAASYGLGILFGGVIGGVFGLFEGSLLSLSYPLISKYRPKWKYSRFGILPAYILFNVVIDKCNQ